MSEFQIKCADGCGTVLGRVTLPDGAKYPGDAHYGFYVPEHFAAKVLAERVEQDQKAADEQAAKDAEFQAKIDAAVDAAIDRKLP